MHLSGNSQRECEKNYHGHYLISARKVSEDGTLGYVQRELNHRVCQTKRRFSRANRAKGNGRPRDQNGVATIANKHLVKAGHEPLDMRSYKKQGIKTKAENTSGR